MCLGGNTNHSRETSAQAADFGKLLETNRDRGTTSEPTEDGSADHTALPLGLRPRELLLTANAVGGFSLSSPPQDFGRTAGVNAAFTTLDEALAWLRTNMAQPAKDVT